MAVVDARGGFQDAGVGDLKEGQRGVPVRGEGCGIEPSRGCGATRGIEDQGVAAEQKRRVGGVGPDDWHGCDVVRCEERDDWVAFDAGGSNAEGSAGRQVAAEPASEVEHRRAQGRETLRAAAGHLWVGRHLEPFRGEEGKRRLSEACGRFGVKR